MNKKLIIWLLILLGIFTVWFYIKNPLTTKVTIHNHEFLVDVAVTEAEKERGLGYRKNLDVNKGMIFPYDHYEQYQFWMKGMNFPIDIIWIRDNSVVYISKNVPVSSDGYLPTYSPHVPVNKVLEINAGLSDKYGIVIGDLVTIRN